MCSQYLRQSWDLALLIVLTTLLCAVYFVGYQGMDDFHYVFAADQWVSSGPFIGENHWHNRLPLVLSMAVSFSLFGRNEVSLVLPNIVFFSFFVIFYWFSVRRLFGRLVSNVATVLLITTPLFSTYVTIAYPVIIETCFVVAAFFLFLRFAFEESRYAGSYIPVLAGVLIGIAFLSRQTAAAGVIALVPVFIMSLHHWKRWFLAGLAFSVVVVTEYLWYWHSTGNFFNRILVDTEGHRTPSFHLKGGTFEGSPILNLDLMSRWVPSGTFDVHWLVNPYLDFFTTASYGFLFWLAIPGIYLIFKYRLYASITQKNSIIGLLLLAVVWFLVTVYVLSLRPQARYFGPIVAVLPVFAAIGMKYLLDRKMKKVATFILIVVVTIHLVLGALRTRPLQLEREVATLISSVTETVYMSQGIFDTSQFFLSVHNSNQRVSVGPAPVGALELQLVEAIDSGTELARIRSSELEQIFDSVGLFRILPTHLVAHFFQKNPVPILVRK